MLSVSGLKEVQQVFTKDPADSNNFTEGQEYKGLHRSVVVHQLEYVDASLWHKVRDESQGENTDDVVRRVRLLLVHTLVT